MGSSSKQGWIIDEIQSEKLQVLLSVFKRTGKRNKVCFDLVWIDSFYLVIDFGTQLEER